MGKNRMRKQSLGLVTLEGDAKKCVERYCELEIKKTEQLYTVSTPWLDGHRFRKQEFETVGELPKVCSQIVLKCLYLVRIGRLVILWSVKKFVRSIAKLATACDKRLNRLISYIHHTCEYKQYCHVGNTAKQCRHRLGLFQDSDFAGDLWNLTKVRSKKEVIDEARTTGADFHFASLKDTCHLINA